jgi:hypothetical protein
MTPIPSPNAPPANRTFVDMMKALDVPWYLILPESRVIRVYHGDLDRSWWTRAQSRGERMAWEVESVIRYATGLQRVSRKHIGDCVDFELSPTTFGPAAVAVRMSFKCLAETDSFTMQLLSRNLPEPRPVKPAKAKKPPKPAKR